MTFNFNYLTDLKDINIAKYALSNQTRFNSRTKNIINFSKITTRLVGVDFVPFLFFTREYYNLLSDGLIIGNFNVVIPNQINFRISYSIDLFVSDTSLTESEKQIIESLFNSYNLSSGIDPLEYIIEQSNLNNISSTLMELVVRFELEKIDSLGNVTALHPFNDKKMRF